MSNLTTLEQAKMCVLRMKQYVDDLFTNVYTQISSINDTVNEASTTAADAKTIATNAQSSVDEAKTLAQEASSKADGYEAAINKNTKEIDALKIKLTDITENTFSVSFENLDDVNVTGVWNVTQARIEF